jgi:molecular chaperone DnaJ
MASRKDYYDILGVRRGATKEEIEKAYQKLARTYQSAPHPGNRTAEFRFKEILEAYEILSNQARRERYDRMGIELPPLDFFEEDAYEEVDEEESGFEGFEDVFEARFEAGQKTIAQPVQKGKDLHCTLEIDFESAVHGTRKEVHVLEEVPCLPCGGKGVSPNGPQKTCEPCGGAGQVQVGIPPLAFSQECSRCRGSGKVLIQRCEGCSGKGWVSQEKLVSLPIPAGVNDRCQIYLPKMGQPGKNGGPRGDLVAEIRLKGHPYFQRRGDDLYIEVPLTLWEAGLGVEVEVPTLEGSKKVKVPPGAQPGDQIRLAGQGVPHLQGGGRGDQVVVLKIVVPPKMNAKSRKILEELKRQNPVDPREECGWRLKS